MTKQSERREITESEYYDVWRSGHVASDLGLQFNNLFSQLPLAKPQIDTSHYDEIIFSGIPEIKPQIDLGAVKECLQHLIDMLDGGWEHTPYVTKAKKLLSQMEDLK